MASDFLRIFLLIIFFNASFSNFLSKSMFSKYKLGYMQINGKILRKIINDKSFYIIDTREITTIALGYIPNSLIVPSSMFSWLYTVIPEMAKVVLITDEQNRDNTIDSFISLQKYELYGYCIYDKIIQTSSFNIQTIEYDPNTYDSIKTIVDNNENIIDIRENKEYKETGVIKQAKLIPLSTFQNDYTNIPKEGNVYVFCKSGARAVVGMSFAKRAGYTNKFIIMKGGMNKAIEEKYPLVPYEG